MKPALHSLNYSYMRGGIWGSIGLQRRSRASSSKVDPTIYWLIFPFNCRRRLPSFLRPICHRAPSAVTAAAGASVASPLIYRSASLCVCAICIAVVYGYWCCSSCCCCDQYIYPITPKSVAYICAVFVRGSVCGQCAYSTKWLIFTLDEKGSDAKNVVG